jgi:tetratricopeptide (TPR) repeat protein
MSLLFSALKQTAQAQALAASSQRTAFTASSILRKSAPPPWRRLGLGLLLGILSGGLATAVTLWLQHRPVQTEPPSTPTITEKPVQAHEPAGIKLETVKGEIPAPVLETLAREIEPHTRPALRQDSDGLTKTNAAQLRIDVQRAPRLEAPFRTENSSPPKTRQAAQNLTSKAVAAAQRGDWEQAQQAQEQAWAIERDNPTWRMNLAILADQRGDQTQALALYRQALAANTASASLPQNAAAAARARVQWLQSQLSPEASRP